MEIISYLHIGTMTADGVLCADDDDDDEISHRSSSVKGGKMSRDPSTDTDVLDTDVGTDDLGSQMSTDEDMAVRLNQVKTRPFICIIPV